jgi:inner membrane protein
MDPVTHGLSSWLVSRAGGNRISPHATTILIVAGLLPDLDMLSFFAGPPAYLRLHHTLTHSLVGGVLLALVIAAAFYLLDRRPGSGSARHAFDEHTAHARTAHPAGNAEQPISFKGALILSLIGVGLHVLLDFCGTDGVRLLWPFSGHFYSWDLLPFIDPIIQFLLLAGIALPALVRLVSDEIGERRRARPPIRGAVIALVFVAAYIGLRADFHSRAVNLLLSHDYHGNVPTIAGAFPEGNSPFSWRGVASTQNTIEVADMSLVGGEPFNAENTVTNFKPDPSATLSAAQQAKVSREFLAVARFPIANIETIDTGYQFTMHDLRFPEDSADPSNLRAVVNLNFENQIVSQAIVRQSSWLSWL